MPGEYEERSTEASSQRFRDLDRWPLERVLAELVAGNKRAVEALERALPQLEAAAKGIAGRLAEGGRLVYAGAGTSGRLALQDAAELPPTFGFDRTVVLIAGGASAGARAREGAEDDTAAALREVEEAGIEETDVVIGIAASGRTPYTVAVLRAASGRGALTIGIANNPETPLLEAADLPICLETGPEVLAGSTRLAAGTAQKIALNALSTAVLVQLGGAYRNLMVGMAPTNAKLQQRAVDIVASASGNSEERAREALELADGEIRVAIVLLLCEVGTVRARELLAVHGNRVRDVLQVMGVDSE